jgi:hypothetical protein
MINFLLLFIAFVAFSIYDTLMNIQAFRESFFARFTGHKWIDPEVSWQNKYKVWGIFQGIFSTVSDLLHFSKSIYLSIFFYFAAVVINHEKISNTSDFIPVWPVWLCWLVIWFLYGYVFEWFLNLREKL